MTLREPTLTPVAIADLRPTQITVGFREVEEKRAAWAKKSGSKGSEFLGEHMIPVIRGPKNRLYVIDHHHLARALLEAKQTEILTNTIADLSTLAKDSFWVVMDCKGWCHPYDASGKRRDFADIPTAVADLVDDPFRSLAGELRRAGGYAKDTTPFSEFIWADFLRNRIKRAAVVANFDKTLEQALVLAKGAEADYLPGWCGPVT
jgi:hypothetical protein